MFLFVFHLIRYIYFHALPTHGLQKTSLRIPVYFRQGILVPYCCFLYLWVMLYASDDLLNWLELGKCKIKTTMRYHYKFTKLAKI